MAQRIAINQLSDGDTVDQAFILANKQIATTTGNSAMGICTPGECGLRAAGFLDEKTHCKRLFAVGQSAYTRQDYLQLLVGCVFAACAIMTKGMFALIPIGGAIAGHLIIANVLALGAISGLMLFIGVPLALGLSLLEVLVCVLQAYVFTLLAVGFIGSAVHPSH